MAERRPMTPEEGRALDLAYARRHVERAAARIKAEEAKRDNWLRRMAELHASEEQMMAAAGLARFRLQQALRLDAGREDDDS